MTFSTPVESGSEALKCRGPLHNDAQRRGSMRRTTLRRVGPSDAPSHDRSDDEYPLGQLYWPKLTGCQTLFFKSTDHENQYVGAVSSISKRDARYSRRSVWMRFIMKVDAMSSPRAGLGGGADHRVLIVVGCDLLHGSLDASIWRGRIAYRQQTEGHISNKEWLPVCRGRAQSS